MSCLPVFVDILVQTIWLMRMFSLLLPQDLMIRCFHFLHGCPLERATLSWIFKRSKRIPSFRSLFQLDETRFVLDANLLRDVLEITPIDQAHQFVSPPSGDAIMDFVNELGIQSTNVDYAKLMWEEFVQAIQTFLTDKANLASPTKKGRKDKPHVIPHCRFTKLIICHLGRTHNIHQRSASPFHLVEEDLRLGNLKFVPKGEKDEVFGMPIPNDLISNNIRNAPYYDACLEMVAKHDKKITAEQGGKKKPATTKQPKPKPAKEKSSKPAPAPKPRVSKERPSKPSHAKHPKRGKVQKLRKGKPSLQLIDEDELTQPDPEPELEHQGKGEEHDVERAIQMSLESFQVQSQAHVGGVAIREPVEEATRPLPVVEGKGKAIAAGEQAAQSLLALHTPKRRIHDSPSLVDAETGADTDKTNSGGDTEILQIGEEQGDDVANMVNIEEKIAEIYKGQVGSDLGKTPEF
ncbi:hypothetical protein Tco_1243808 [Tanacetum coccineum]